MNSGLIYKLSKNLKAIYIALALLIAPLLVSSPLSAQVPPLLDSQDKTITEIQFKGLNLIDQGVVYSSIKSRAGVRISSSLVADDIKTLYKLGYFRDISVDLETLDEERIILIFRVWEKPKIVKIEIEGNNIIDTSDLEEKLKVFPNNMINLKKINEDVKTIRSEYQKKGYLQTQVSYELEDIDRSSALLKYKVVEFSKVYLTEINITGTKVYPPLDIKRLMTSSEIDCFSWITDSGVFQEEKINQDLQIIVQHYLQNGFIKVKLDKPKVAMIINGDYLKLKVDININEGDQYTTGKVDATSDDQGLPLLFDKKETLEKMSLKSGDIYNPFKQNQDRFRIYDIYQERGYAFARPWVENSIDEKNKTVDVIYHVKRGEKIYIGRIDIQGNYETLDSVIRRELEIHDNQLFNGPKLRESIQEITRLGYFEAGTGVRTRQKPVKDANVLDYDILLKEGQTGSFNASLAYSAKSGVGLILSLAKRNILGTGKSVKISSQHDDEGSRYDFTMSNPYFFDTEIINSFRFFAINHIEDYYTVKINGFNFTLSYPFWRYWQVFSTYSYKNENYMDLTSVGKDILRDLEKSLYRSVSLGIKYDTVDHPMFPSKGYEVTLFSEQFGGYFGGNVEYRTYSFNSRYFKTLNKSGSLVFGAKFRWSYLYQNNAEKAIPTHRRFFIGGINTVRGFEWEEIRGPSSRAESNSAIYRLYPYKGDYDSESCQATPSCAGLPDAKDPNRAYFERHDGGIEQRIINLQLYYPLTREGNNIRGVVFFDMGNVWSEDKMYELVGLEKDPWYYRKSAGLGVNIVTPMGVLRFEYGYKLDRKESEAPSKFEFYVSGLF